MASVSDESSVQNRRDFLKKSALVAGSAFFAPTIVPASVFGRHAPSNRINIGCIGVGRISRGHDMPGIWKYEQARIIGVCDVDSKRVQEGKQLVEEYYSQKKPKKYKGVQTYTDYRDLLANKDIDAVVISTPDHWHALPAIEAAMAGKDIYLQKPASLTITEGRTLSNVIQKQNRIFQIGSQQRSSPQFRYAAELVRNGRIGKLHTIYVGLPGDPSGNEEPEMPVPANLNYNMWLGSTPEVYYTEKRVHPHIGYDRPGWLRCEQFGAGMITGWGSHHIDCAHWAMDTEYTGPIEVSGWADFPSAGLWNVHGKFRTEALYANGVRMIVSNDLPNGIKYEGSEGWIFVTRGNYTATASDPVVKSGEVKPLEASNPSVLSSVIGPNEVHLYESKDHHGNWLDCIVSRKAPIAPVEVAHRSCSTCLIHHIAMKLKRKVFWDPAKEQFINDAEANLLLSRQMRAPYQIKA
ncbi:Gfo/Idh/MocA family oxidoreductase [Cytophagaceae bacterium DM2B3-1]|uniref:Gfo/Idh/MocA family oxidoreductase n=1 Tax=Xanthocytophaga flava TaxID=3048013 RepID=A0ABT7CKD6_9BACT|nr:Gfo/Idh/MocA family oxidoreductase [Xanthocytophaga flavus]MDJ1469320.1 Gfo/Idh/MocA family oxidoreductase [Xanthocytophaga flavus]MDJ1494220.1 Gfo/Idh/MocA family oxidoreductase [Xanthocytophaga flavus]